MPDWKAMLEVTSIVVHAYKMLLMQEQKPRRHTAFQIYRWIDRRYFREFVRCSF